MPGQLPQNLILAAARLIADREYAAHSARADREGGAAEGHSAWPAFRSLVISNRDAVINTISTRRVQTNEIGRAAALLPVFARLAHAFGQPLGLIEIGTSAGLLLNMDRYRFIYDVEDHGDIAIGPDSPVVIRSQWRGLQPPSFDPPPIASRVGLDLTPIDPMNRETAAWLRALVWPGNRARGERLSAALELAVSNPPPLQAGDAADLLPAALDAVPDGVLPLVFHCATIAHIPEAGRVRIAVALRAHAKRREVVRVSAESPSAAENPFAIHALCVTARGEDDAALGRCHHHGAWVQLLA
jgi:hypothetical protein